MKKRSRFPITFCRLILYSALLIWVFTVVPGFVSALISAALVLELFAHT